MNREKTSIVYALKDRYALPMLLSRIKLSRNSYYCRKASLVRIDQYQELRNQICVIVYDNNACHGYRRVHAALKKNAITVSEKAVCKLMQRDFHAESPNQKWLTGIAEFAIPAGKVYLSSVVDCFDGMLPAWTIDTAPDAALVNEMLDKAAAALPQGKHTLIHSDYAEEKTSA